MSKILLVDDAKDVHLILNEVFDSEYSLTSAFSLNQASQLLDSEVFDLILLDIILPDGDGLDFCATLQSKSTLREIPVIFLTGKNDFAAKSIGFSLGAEDFIVKPFDASEVKLRCVAKIRKYQSKGNREAVHQIGDLRFEIRSQRIYLRQELNEKKLELTPTGFKLLLYLAQNEGQVFTRDQLINSVWGHGTYIVDRTVDTHVGALRKQLAGSRVSVQSVHGQGYRLVVAEPISGMHKFTAA